MPSASIFAGYVVAKGRVANEKFAETDHMVRGGRNVIENVGMDERVDRTVMHFQVRRNDGFLMTVLLL